MKAGAAMVLPFLFNQQSSPFRDAIDGVKGKEYTFLFGNPDQVKGVIAEGTEKVSILKKGKFYLLKGIESSIKKLKIKKILYFHVGSPF
jgi:hypothetical protein